MNQVQQTPRQMPASAPVPIGQADALPRWAVATIASILAVGLLVAGVPFLILWPLQVGALLVGLSASVAAVWVRSSRLARRAGL
jgi:hypothetical protein